MSEITSYRDLDAWNVGMELAVAAFHLSHQLPSSERYELAKQIRRSASSVPANVAEGHATGFTGMFLRHVAIALGSAAELETHLELAIRLGMLAPKQIQSAAELIERAGQLLHGLRRSLRLRLARKAGTVIVMWFCLQTYLS
jgi:four helix bundle protein